MWDGTYLDDQKMTGTGKYKFYDEEDGNLKVAVSWKDKKMILQKMELKGKRLGIDAMQLEGKHKDTTYRYMGRMEDSGLVLRYLSIDGKGKSGSGVSTLTRQK